MTDSIAVIGATGNVGRKVVELLLARGLAVSAVARNADKLDSLGDRGVEVCQGSLENKAFLASVFARAKAAFILCPVNITARNVNDDQRYKIDAIGAAVRESGMDYKIRIKHTERTNK